MAAPQRPMTAFEWGLLGLLSLLWGGSFFFIGVAVKALPPLAIVAARVGIAALLLWASAPLTGLSPRRIAGQAGPLIILGLVNNAIPFTLIVWSQTRIASGLAAILNAATPLVAVIVGHVFTDSEKLTMAKLAGAIVGFIGVAAMIGPDVALGGGRDALAELAVLGAAVSYALGGFYARRFRSRGLGPIDIATGQLSASSALIVPLALIVHPVGTLAAPGLAAAAAVLALASLSTAFAYIVYFRILAGAGATNVLLVTLLAPATSIALGAASLGERLPPAAFFGLALIACGLALIDGRAPRALVRLIRG